MTISAEPISSAELRDAGVYMIRNRKTGARYIGSSMSLKKRYQAHRTTVHTGCERAPKLYREAFSDCTLQDLEFKVLEPFKVALDEPIGWFSDARNRLFERETAWIAAERPEANLRTPHFGIDFLEGVLAAEKPGPVELVPSKICLFSVYNDDVSDRVIVRARSHHKASLVAAELRGWPAQEVIVRYLKTVSAGAGE